MGDNTMNNGLVGLGLAMAMVIIGGIALWFTFGPIVMNAIETIMAVL